MRIFLILLVGCLPAGAPLDDLQALEAARVTTAYSSAISALTADEVACVDRVRLAWTDDVRRDCRGTSEEGCYRPGLILLSTSLVGQRYDQVSERYRVLRHELEHRTLDCTGQNYQDHSNPIFDVGFQTTVEETRP